MSSRNILRRAPKTIRLAVAEYQALKNPVLPIHEQPESADAALLAKLEPTANEARPAQDEIYGWIRSIRAHKNVSFAEIDDGTARIQSVLKGKGRADGLALGSGVKLEGRIKESKGQGQEVEFEADVLSVLGDSDPATYPIQKKSLPLPYLRDHAHLRFRTAHTAAVMRVRDALMREWHDWFEENEFIHIHTPILTSSDCEGAGEVFTLANPAVHHPSSSSSSASSTASSVSPSTSSTTQQPESFFQTRVNLTVSSQLHLEAPTHSLARTYTLSPSFRAEPSLTSRHLSEFYMLEGEVAFVDTLDGLMDMVEDGLRWQARRIMWGAGAASSSESYSPILSMVGRGGRHERVRRDLETILATQESESSDNTAAETDFEARGDRAPLAHLINLAARPFARISYKKAVELCIEHQEEATFKRIPNWETGLGTEHEKWLAGHFDGPVFITHYPKTVKPFYMLPSDADPSFGLTYRHEGAEEQGRETVACFDLVFPGIGELVGGSLREHRHDVLRSRIAELGMKEEEYQWYLDLRKYGSVPHGGWGMGFDRWVCWVTGVGNVRDVVPFPRWRGNCRY